MFYLNMEGIKTTAVLAPILGAKDNTVYETCDSGGFPFDARSNNVRDQTASSQYSRLKLKLVRGL